MGFQETEKAKQAYASLGVAFVCLVIGLPLWWKTTTVYRVQLPHGKIAELQDKQVQCRVDVTIITFEDIDRTDLAIFGENLKEALEGNDNAESLIKVKYMGNIRHAYEEEMLVLKSSASLEELDAKLDKLKILHENGKYTFLLLPRNSSSLKGHDDDIIIGRRNNIFLKQTTGLEELIKPIKGIIQNVLVREDEIIQMTETAAASRKAKDEKQTMRSVKKTSGYHLTFTLLNPEPEVLNVQWSIQSAIKVYLQPFLEKMGDFVNITVTSQVLHYTKLSLRPRKDGSGDSVQYILKPDDLPHMINPIESKLGSHVSNYPTLDFLVYVPSRSQSPLNIHDEQGKPSPSNAFLSPRWGGVHIYNVQSPSGTQPALVDLDMKPVMEVFLSQLQLLMGFHQPVLQQGVKAEGADNSVLTSWVTDAWLREKTLENLSTSRSTLRSLSLLLERIRNMIINDDIGQEVEEAVENIEKCHSFLFKGDLREAYFASKKALLSSEKAFFDPSLLELLYFPEDQKFAIYIPLFLPISIPVLLSLRHAANWLRSKKDKTKTNQHEKDTKTE